MRKHEGPGPHPGTGTEQEVHGRRGVAVGPAKRKELVEAIRTNGGFTYSPSTDSSPTSGFAVSPFKHAEMVFDEDVFARSGESIIDDYIKGHTDLLLKKGAHLGGWHDTEAKRIYLDVSIVVPERALAERLARDADQEAYFDLGAMETVMVKAPEERRKREGRRVRVTMAPLSELRTRAGRQRFAASILRSNT